MNNNLNDYFIILSTSVVTLNSISIPLGYNIIADKLQPYLDEDVFRIFINDHRFTRNIILSLSSLAFFLIALLIDITKIFRACDQDINKFSEFFFLLFSIFIFVWFLATFITFSLMIYEYAFNTDEIIFLMTQREIDEFLNEE